MINLSTLPIPKRRGKARGIKTSRRHELWYRGQLLSLVKRLRDHTEAAISAAIKANIQSSDGYTKDETPRWINEALSFSRASFNLSDTYAKMLALQQAKRVSGYVDDSFISTMKAVIGIDVSALMAPHGIKAMMDKATDANIYLIKSIPSEYFGKLQEAITANWESGMRPENLISTIAHIGDVTESRAKLIARDQTAKMNSAFTQVRQVSVGINSYIWQTAGDERVREEHAMMDGETVRWDSPPSIGNVGEEVNCRCVAIPVIESDDGSDFDPIGSISNAVAAYEFGVAAADLASNAL